ncbi:Crp/Fnr family transcriptional regulator [Dehalobacterium formicoaceticum]|uniref:Crp/Fnr family transcriptional regulator n=1 Tax=Dehalobacterium formicoaceticum TaxID=51515 RepID=A0ABT1Y220_9FIRM|nr:Crp/Fnr family transcriptional regulator [Dehalobacterium formicoaceticum]MCR6544927.1 Crp/Fnr family transcriptional regulator [Dehalobacterium formicoaceticum]
MSSQIWDKYLHLGTKILRKSGEYIIAVSDNPAGLYFLNKGKVKGGLLSKDGMLKTISIKAEKTIFGEQFVFHHQPGIYEAIAIEDCELYFFTRERILEVMKEDFEITLFIAKSQSILSRMMAYQIYDMSVSNILRSLARVLYSICCYEKKENPQNKSITINLTHEQIANMLGAHRVTITKNLNRLKNLGILDYKYEKIMIKEPQKLLDIATE